MELSSQVHAALTKPLAQRCLDLKILIENYPYQDFQPVLPVIVENVFGSVNKIGWDLKSLSSYRYYDFQQATSFLAPHGPLLTVIYWLTQDFNIQYSFPLSNLPSSAGQSGISSFCAEKMNQRFGESQLNSSLSLNAFEFYFFHFFNYLSNTQKFEHQNSQREDSVSFCQSLLTAYLDYYLPCDGLPCQVSNYLHTLATQVVSSPTVTHFTSSSRSPLHNSSSLSSTFSSSFSSIQTSMRSPSRLHTNYSKSNSITENKCWPSQVFIQIFVEFFLSRTMSDNQLTLNSSFNSHLNVGGSIYQRSNPFDSFLRDNQLPSVETVGLLRMFIKHMHMFVGSAHQQVRSASFSPSTSSTLDDFKRNVVPQFINKRLYFFLRHSFHKWPLDSSFRMILETWLSYVQPWRYKSSKVDRIDTSKVVEPAWRNFVAENLLFYTVLLREFFSRTIRMDLTSHKNTYMLFRVLKIFNSLHLTEYIEIAESSLLEPSKHLEHFDRHASADQSFSSLNLASSIDYQISELEGPNYLYQPLFSSETRTLVYKIINQIVDANHSVKDAQKRSDEVNQGSFWSFMSSSSQDFNTTPLYDDWTYDEFDSMDPRKLTLYLDNSITFICNIFQVEAPERSVNRSVSWGDESSDSHQLSPDVIMTNSSYRLSPLGRYQLKNGMRKFEIGYHGDPDLQPIRSDECPAAVRILYQISNALNTWFQPQITDYCHRPGFVGKLSRQLFCTKTLTCQTISSPSRIYSPRDQEASMLYSKPRVSLRWLAKYRLLSYLLVICAIIYWFIRPSFFTYFFFLMLIGLLVALCRAFFNTDIKLSAEKCQ